MIGTSQPFITMEIHKKHVIAKPNHAKKEDLWINYVLHSSAVSKR